MWTEEQKVKRYKEGLDKGRETEGGEPSRIENLRKIITFRKCLSVFAVGLSLSLSLSLSRTLSFSLLQRHGAGGFVGNERSCS